MRQYFSNKMSDRIILHEKIIEKIKRTCEINKVKFTLNNLLEDLQDCASKDKEKSQIAKYWNSIFEEPNEDISRYRLGHALSRKPKIESGCRIELANFLCYYAKLKNYESAVKRYGSSINKETKISGQIKNNIEKSEKIKEGDQTFNIKSFDKIHNTFNVLILPFRNREDGNISRVGKELEFRLLEKNRIEKLNLTIEYAVSYDSEVTYEKAKNIMKEVNADIVIFGNHSKSDNHLIHQIYFHYVIAESLESINPKDKTEKFETDRLIEIAEGSLQLEIDDVVYWIYGCKLHRDGDFENSFIQLTKIKNSKYINEDLFCILAYNLFRLDSDKEAKICYEKALRIDPLNFVANFNYAALISDSNIQKAEFYFETAFLINPTSPLLHANYGEFIFNAYKDMDKAEFHFKKALELDPNLAFGHYVYGKFLAVICFVEDAFKHLKIAKKLKPRAHLGKTINSKIDDFQKNEEGSLKFAAVLKSQPNAAVARFTLGLYLETQLKNLDWAKIQYELALKIDPYYKEALECYLDLLLRLTHDLDANYIPARNSDARKKCEFHLRNQPNNSKALLVYSILLMGEPKDEIKARESYLKALSIDPKINELDLSTFFGVGK